VLSFCAGVYGYREKYNRDACMVVRSSNSKTGMFLRIALVDGWKEKCLSEKSSPWHVRQMSGRVVGSRVSQWSKALHLSARGVTTDPG
jgi:hypothetical protein